jgi:hypothetical protein
MVVSVQSCIIQQIEKSDQSVLSVGRTGGGRMDGAGESFGYGGAAEQHDNVVGGLSCKSDVRTWTLSSI